MADIIVEEGLKATEAMAGEGLKATEVAVEAGLKVLWDECGVPVKTQLHLQASGITTLHQFAQFAHSTEHLHEKVSLKGLHLNGHSAISNAWTRAQSLGEVPKRMGTSMRHTLEVLTVGDTTTSTVYVSSVAASVSLPESAPVPESVPAPQSGPGTASEFPSTSDNSQSKIALAGAVAGSGAVAAQQKKQLASVDQVKQSGETNAAANQEDPIKKETGKEPLSIDQTNVAQEVINKEDATIKEFQLRNEDEDEGFADEDEGITWKQSEVKTPSFNPFSFLESFMPCCSAGRPADPVLA